MLNKLLPLLLPFLSCVYLALFHSLRIHLWKRSLAKLEETHWTEQNRIFWEGSLFHKAWLFGTILVGLGVSTHLYFDWDSWFLLPTIALFLILLLFVQFRGRRLTNEIRARWGRVDLSTYPLGTKITFSLLYLPLIAPALAAPFIPSEFGIQSILLITAILLASILFNGWGTMWLLQKRGHIVDAPEAVSSLVDDLAEQQKITPSPKTWLLHAPLLNAFAYQLRNAVIFTQPLIDRLSSAQIRAIGAHEIGHLQEGPWSRWIRTLSPVIFLPILCFRPLLAIASPLHGLLIVFAGTFLIGRVYGFFLRRSERVADQAASESEGEEEEDQTYGEALSIIYEENLFPATMPKGTNRTHPDLYDRLRALGIDPVYPRPSAPRSRRETLLVVLALVVLFFGLYFLATALGG